MSEYSGVFRRRQTSQGCNINPRMNATDHLFPYTLGLHRDAYMTPQAFDRRGESDKVWFVKKVGDQSRGVNWISPVTCKTVRNLGRMTDRCLNPLIRLTPSLYTHCLPSSLQEKARSFLSTWRLRCQRSSLHLCLDCTEETL